jgi:hypothetical protein
MELHSLLTPEILWNVVKIRLARRAKNAHDSRAIKYGARRSGLPEISVLNVLAIKRSAA